MTSKNTARPAAIFWDMDGTLIDSEPEWGVATYEMSERFGRRLTPELREATVGGTFLNTVTVCANHAGISLDDVDLDAEEDRIYSRMAELIKDIEPKPGVRSLLAELTGIPMYVTTNTYRRLADPSISAVGREFFVGSIAGDEVERPKPAPDMYLKAAELAGAAPGDCLIFEDSWAGMTAAAGAGCRVIGLATQVPEGVTSLAELHGSLSLEGVTAEHVYGWFDKISPREEL